LRAASTGPDAAFLEETDSAGVEKPLAVMFLDLRGFTNLSNGRLPYDVVYMLNQFFAGAGVAITSNGGWIDKVMGDGLLAVFGQRLGVEAGCRQALRAARDIDLALDHVNAKLEAEIGQPLKIGIGIHAGPLLLGRIGYGEAVELTVVGTVVNVASRLEGIAKEKGCQIVLSRDVARYAGWMDSEQAVTKVKVSGVEGPIEVINIARGRDLPTRLLVPIEGAVDPIPTVHRYGV
jgi:adenylate cyclase